jgi:SAM-dependent methyltransferase
MNPLGRIRNRARARTAQAQAEAFADAHSTHALRQLIEAAGSVLDLGSGPNPIECATAAVDLLLEPSQRGHGAGGVIDPEAMKARGIRFVNQSIDQQLPFDRMEFGLVYCSHVIEHVDNPGKACDEMMRVAKTGLLRCPNAMAEYLYGREYHKWLVLQRGGTIIFLEKTPDEFAPFGDSRADTPETVNPFEALLDWAGERPSTGTNGIIARLRERLQRAFYSREPLSEINLFWNMGFSWIEVRADGRIKQGGSPGRQWHYDAEGLRQDWCNDE